MKNVLGQLDEIESNALDGNYHLDDLYLNLIDLKSHSCGKAEALADEAIALISQLRTDLVLIRSSRREIDEALFPAVPEATVQQ